MKNALRYLLVIGCSIVFFGCQEDGSSEKPNVLFILVDDLGYSDLGYTGSASYETPNIDALAASAAIFTNAYAASPVCSPARAAILSGKYPARLNLTDYIPGNRHYGPHEDQKLASKPFKLHLELKEYTLAEAFEDAGYSTMFAGKWHLGEEDKYYPQFQGFEINKGGNKTGHPKGGYFSPYNNPQLEDGKDEEYLTDRITSEVIRFIENRKDKPFFAYLSFYTVHLPLEAKAEKVEEYEEKFKGQFKDEEVFVKKGETFYKKRQNIPSYAAMIASMDENVGRVLETLEQQGVSENTIIVFTSDNGGMATSNTPHNIPTTNLPLRAGKGYLYEGGIREPLLLKWPKKVPEGILFDSPVTSTDLYPTLLDLAAIDLRPEQHVDGQSLVPLLKGGLPIDRPLFWHYPHYSGGLGGRPSGAVRLGQYKLIEFYEDMNIELYHLSDDPEEKNDLSLTESEKANHLQEILHKWRMTVGAQMPYSNTHFKK